VLLHQHNTAVA